MEQPTTCERQCKIITPEAGHSESFSSSVFHLAPSHPAARDQIAQQLDKIFKWPLHLFHILLHCVLISDYLGWSPEPTSVVVYFDSHGPCWNHFHVHEGRDLHVLQDPGLFLGAAEAQRMKPGLMGLAWRANSITCHRSVMVIRACDVGGKSTHLVSRVPDTHCACSDPPITLVLTQRAEADQALHMGWVAGNNTEKWATTRENHEHEDLVPKRKAASVIWNYFSYKQDDTDRTRVLCRQWRHLLLQTEVTFRSVPHSSVRQQQVTSQQQCSITGAVQLIWWKFLYFFILQYISQGYKKSQCQFFPISCSSNHVEDASIWPVESVSLKLLWLICFFLLVC